jgi:carbon storage regulator CsrA
MLVLTRKIGQTIIITLEDGREMELVVLDLSGFDDRKTATIGIEAAKTIKIMRKEVKLRQNFTPDFNKRESMEISEDDDTPMDEFNVL